jgi:kynurenine formamidase
MSIQQPTDVVGGLARLNAASVLAALSIVKRGEVISLDSQWWRGMPAHPVHPRFEVITYRTPHGEQIQKDQEYLNEPANTVNYGFISELIMGTSHTGTHIDALCHTTCGDNSEWFGGHSADEYLGDFGALNSDAAALTPIVARGVLLDIPRALGLDYCPANFAIGAEQLRAAADAQGVEVREGDAVLVRTGQMQFWPDMDALAVAADSGVSLDGAQWLLDRRPSVVGADNVAFECAPSGVDGSPQPAHVLLIQQNGIPIMEWVDCERLAAEELYEFAFVCLPLSVRGATGSMVRPVAIV